MVSLAPLPLALTAVTALTLGAFLYFSFLVHRGKGGALAWRGIVKIISLGGVPEQLKTVFSGCVNVGYLVWGTDHSFLIVIFPLLFYYFFARYFLWEKADLTD
jgi:hypothetical protein